MGIVLAKLPRSTNREEMEAVDNGDGPLGNERLIKYGIFLTDAFAGRAMGVSFYEAPGAPDQIDGFTNDDSYRRSRHLLNSNNFRNSNVNFDNIRENSLARQLNAKPDRPAVIRLIRRRSKEELSWRSTIEPGKPQVPWVNLIPPNTKFFLESVQENREEKVQVIDTFGEWIAFFFGKKPEVYSYSGTLLNAQNHNWKNEFQENYDYYLRGTQAVKNRATVFMQYDDVMVEGYILNTSINMSGMADTSVPFQFNMLVINRGPLDPRAILGLRLDRSGGTSAEEQLFETMQETLDLTRTGDIADLETFLLMREYFSGHYVPGAGTTVHRDNTNDMDSPVSVRPGQKGGVNNEQAESQLVNTSMSDAITDSGQELIDPYGD